MCGNEYMCVFLLSKSTLINEFQLSDFVYPNGLRRIRCNQCVISSLNVFV